MTAGKYICSVGIFRHRHSPILASLSYAEVFCQHLSDSIVVIVKHTKLSERQDYMSPGVGLVGLQDCMTLGVLQDYMLVSLWLWLLFFSLRLFGLLDTSRLSSAYLFAYYHQATRRHI
jgi:hypothetical protein